jgi:hypothetical protein
MQCPRCEAEVRSEPGGESPPTSKSKPQRAEAGEVTQRVLRADTPPAPCPQCGWSTMWNE